MRYLLLIALLLAATVALARKEESLAELKQQAESAREGKQVELLLKIAQMQLQATDAAYSAGNSDQAQQGLRDVVSYATRAAQVAADTGKKMKQAEINVRRISARLQDIARGLSFDDRPPVTAAVDTLEKARTDLLSRMFRK